MSVSLTEHRAAEFHDLEATDLISALVEVEEVLKTFSSLNYVNHRKNAVESMCESTGSISSTGKSSSIVKILPILIPSDDRRLLQFMYLSYIIFYIGFYDKLDEKRGMFDLLIHFWLLLTMLLHFM